jgi:hypothetical protein
MDQDRFDQMTRALASGTSRRTVLRRVGVALGGALGLTAFGAGKPAAAQLVVLGPPPVWTHCTEGPSDPFALGGGAKTCGHCHAGDVCVALLNPANTIVCRCISTNDIAALTAEGYEVVLPV